MASAVAIRGAAFSRRQLLSTLIAADATGVAAADLSMRRPGRVGIRDTATFAAMEAVATPPLAVGWLTRCTFGYTTADFTAFNALAGGSDDVRWQNWVALQLNPASIADTACNTRLSAGAFTTLNKTVDQLWADHHASTDYFTRLLPVAETECATIIRQTYSQRQLYEVMVDFWHDHFSVFGWDYDGGPMFVAMDRDAIRPYANALGNFRSMLQAVGQSASMMYMLDLYASNSTRPNENYARELLELHTLGTENYGGIVQNPDSFANMTALGHFTAWDGNEERLKYVDDDVYEAARALTGWTISGANYPYATINGVALGGFAYNDATHDQLTKHVLAEYFAAYQGQVDGTMLYDILAQHPSTAHHVAGKLCNRFVGDGASQTLVQGAADIFHSNWQAANQISLVMTYILQSAEFKASWGAKMKRPANSIISALRGTGADFTPKPDNNSAIYTPTEELIGRMQQAGHRLFYWPAPNGYPDNQIAWSSTGAMGMTLRMLPRLLEMHQTESYNEAYNFIIDIQGQTLAQFPVAANRTAANIVGYWCDRLLGYRPEPVNTVAVDFFRQNAAATAALDLTTDNGTAHTGTYNAGNLSKHYTIARLRVTVGLILCSPDFLRR